MDSRLLHANTVEFETFGWVHGRILPPQLAQPLIDKPSATIDAVNDTASSPDLRNDDVHEPSRHDDDFLYSLPFEVRHHIGGRLGGSFYFRGRRILLHHDLVAKLAVHLHRD